MKFSPQQEEALKAVSRWVREGQSQIFRLFGYAGTGKTTLARSIAEHIDGDVLFAAFTGKAAQVLRSKGASDARTIHSLIYRPRGEEQDEESGEGVPLFSLNRKSPVSEAALVIIDECSMVGEDLGRDLMSFGTPILVLGDPAQLPPVSGGGFFTDHPPDIMLTQVHRQARDNPIIALASQVREGGMLTLGRYGESAVISKADIDTQDVLKADQVLVGTNRTRKRYNVRLRELEGFQSRLPSSGDKLVCLRNKAEKGLLNGSLWRVASSGSPRGQGLQLMIRSDEEGGLAKTIKVKVPVAAFEQEGDLPYALRRRFDEFDYGYALTVHKAQGSQWDDVVLFDESWAFKEYRQQWLYTAITRASQTLTIVQ
jgi:exodeoxyribonuclease-5